MKIIYETERLIVRQWEEADCDDLFEYASDKDVTKFLTFPTYQSIDDARERIADVRQRYEKDLINYDYCIEHKTLKKVIGSISNVHYDESNDGQVEIGYVLNPEFQGHGFMTECLQAMFKYIKQNKIAKRIIARHDIANFKSGNVMKRAGMTLEGILRKAGTNNYHSRHDLALYSILDEEIDLDK